MRRELVTVLGGQVVPGDAVLDGGAFRQVVRAEPWPDGRSVTLHFGPLDGFGEVSEADACLTVGALDGVSVWRAPAQGQSLSVIVYWQGCLRLSSAHGACGQGAGLPQDEVTAAVVLGAILARNFFVTHQPGCYRAEVHGRGGVVPSVVAEDDARVRAARRVLCARTVRRDFRAADLEHARQVLCSSAAGP